MSDRHVVFYLTYMARLNHVFISSHGVKYAPIMATTQHTCEMNTVSSRLISTAFARHMHLTVAGGLAISGLLLLFQISIAPIAIFTYVGCVFFSVVLLAKQQITCFPTWLYLILFILVFLSGGLFTNENGMSYWYPALAAHVMFNQPQTRQRLTVLIPASILFMFHLAQPHQYLAIATATETFTFSVTVIALSSGFVLVGLHASRLQRLWHGYKIQSEALNDYLALVRESSIVLARLRPNGEVVTLNERAEALFLDKANGSMHYPMNLAAAVEQAVRTQTIVSFNETIGNNPYQFRVMPNKRDETLTLFGEDLKNSRAESQLSKVLFDAVENTADCAMVVDSQLHIQYNNRATAIMFGIDNPDQLIGTSWLQLWPENERERLKTRILNKLKVNTTWCGAIFCLRQDGQRIRVVMSLTRIRDGSLLCKLLSPDVFAITEDGLRINDKSTTANDSENGSVTMEESNEVPISPSPHLAENLPMKVLVVDDDEINRQLATYIFAKMGYSVDLAENGAVALARCQEMCYDLILMDIHMPIMGGLEATAAIRRIVNCNPKIIVATADPIKYSSSTLSQHQIDGLLVKPFRTSELEEVIRHTGQNKKCQIQTPNLG